MPSVQAFAQGIGAFASTRNNQIRTLLAIREAKAQKRAAEVESMRTQKKDALDRNKTVADALKNFVILGQGGQATPMTPQQAQLFVEGKLDNVNVVPYSQLSAFQPAAPPASAAPVTPQDVAGAADFSSKFQYAPHPAAGLPGGPAGPPAPGAPPVVPAQNIPLRDSLDAFHRGTVPESAAGFQPVPEAPKATGDLSPSQQINQRKLMAIDAFLHGKATERQKALIGKDMLSFAIRSLAGNKFYQYAEQPERLSMIRTVMEDMDTLRGGGPTKKWAIVDGKLVPVPEK
jgi:hypothetical protein